MVGLMSQLSQRPKCKTCGNVVPYDPTPKFAYSYTKDRNPTVYFCNEECMKPEIMKAIKEMKGENTNEPNAVRSSEED